MVKTDSSLLEWEGRHGTHGNKRVLWVENMEGHPFMAIATGAVVPENWHGRKVKITVELLSERSN